MTSYWWPPGDLGAMERTWVSAPGHRRLEPLMRMSDMLWPLATAHLTRPCMQTTSWKGRNSQRALDRRVKSFFILVMVKVGDWGKPKALCSLCPWPDTAPGFLLKSLHRRLCCLSASERSGKERLSHRDAEALSTHSGINSSSSHFRTQWNTGSSYFLCLLLWTFSNSFSCPSMVF